MMRFRQKITGAALALALSLGAVNAQATTALLLTRAQLVQRSDLVVRATVLSVESSWTEDKTAIVTSTRLKVSGTLKGRQASELVLRQLGGRVGEEALVIPGEARLEVGEEVVLFLKDGQGGVVGLTAMAQAAYHVRGDKVQRDMEGLQLMRMVGGKLRPMPHKPEPREALAKLMADVVRIVRGR